MIDTSSITSKIASLEQKIGYLAKKMQKTDKLIRKSHSFTSQSILVNTQRANDFVMSAIPDLKPTTLIKLLYRGSIDGWKAKDFHRLCDNQGPTVTLVKSSAGRVSGGFTTVSWTSAYGDKTDAKALLFSVDSEVMFPCIQHDQAVVHESYHGPNFGNANLQIADMN